MNNANYLFCVFADGDRIVFFLHWRDSFVKPRGQLVKFICDKMQLSLLVGRAASRVRRLPIVRRLNCKIRFNDRCNLYTVS